jgi:hypothetical protein
MNIQELKLKSSEQLITQAEELGIENASTLRKQEILFAILKKVAEKEEITGAGVLQLLKDMFVGFGSIFFDNAILILHINAVNFDIEFIPLILKLLPTIFSLTGLVLSFLIYILFKTVVNKILHNLFFRKIYIFLNTK